MEAADQDTRELHTQSTELILVNAVTQLQYLMNKLCFHCGQLYSMETCQFKDLMYKYCKKTGHIVRACCSKQKAVESQNLNHREGTYLATML